MNRSRILVIAASIALAFAIGWGIRFCFFLSPADQLARVQSQLITAIEDRDYKTLESLMSADYLDDFGHDRATALEAAKQIFSGYFSLTIQAETTWNKGTRQIGMVKQKLKVEGNGTPVSQMVTTRVNQTTEPFVFHWQNKGRWPWDWRLVQVQNEYIK